MKHTPYTVPEDYFEKTEKLIVRRTDEIRKRRIIFLSLCPVIITMTLAFIGIHKPSATPARETTAALSQTAASFDCDIFLEVFEY